jgi:hypothetical protein
MTKTELIKKIQAANEAYSMGIPFMTDTEYDILWQELYALDADNPILYHTARNISVVSGAITHRYPVYGTFKAFNMQDLRPFLMRFGSKELIIEQGYDPKFGARPLRRTLERMVEYPIAEMILKGEIQQSNIIKVTAIKGEIKIDVQ